MTQQEAADAAGLSRQAWQNYENGRAIILRSDVQTRIARALGGDRDELLSHLEVVQGHARTASRGQAFNDPQSAPEGLQQGRAVFPLSEGQVTITFPEGLSEEGFAELGDYLQIFLKTRGPKRS